VQSSVDHYIRAYGRRLYGLCLHLCDSPHEADDLYQDTWLKVVANIGSYDPARDFEPWLTRICVNTYRNALRRLARSPFVGFGSTEEHDAALAGVAAPEEAPEEYGPLHREVRRLPQKLRLVVVLFYFKDMDVAATARALGIPAGTVKSRLNKARRLLKEALGHEPGI